MWLRSIRWQIQAWHGLLLTLITTALLFAFYHYERRGWLQRMDDSLRQTVLQSMPGLIPHRGRPPGPPPQFSSDQSIELAYPPSPGRPPFGPPGDGPPEDQGARDFVAQLGRTSTYYTVWDSDGALCKKSPNVPGDIPFPPIMGANGSTQIRSRDGFRELIHFAPEGRMVLIGMPMTEAATSLRHLALALAGIGSGVILAGLAGGWWLANRAIQPIQKISAAAEQIAEGDLSKRIDATETDSELGALARVLNHTFERLDESFQQQVRFTADASHELRTPVSVILTETQSALSRERAAGDYRESLEVVQRAGQRMRNLINSLLELARVDSGEFALHLEKCEVADVCKEALGFIAPLARERHAELTESLEPIAAEIDPQKIGQVLNNLLANALQHNPEGVKIRVTLRHTRGHAVITVSDNGLGIPREALPHIFDRFYCVDKSRSRAKGGTGLGLAIAKAISEAHGGTLTATSMEGKGTEFVLALPLKVGARTKNVSRGDANDHAE